MRVVHLGEKRQFLSAKFLPELVYGSPGARVFLLCLEPGQGPPARRDSEEVVCYVVEGRARLREGQEEALLEAGDLAGVAAGATRAITAVERAVVLWIHLATKDVTCDDAETQDRVRGAAPGDGAGPPPVRDADRLGQPHRRRDARE